MTHQEGKDVGPSLGTATISSENGGQVSSAVFPRRYGKCEWSSVPLYCMLVICSAIILWLVVSLLYLFESTPASQFEEVHVG